MSKEHQKAKPFDISRGAKRQAEHQKATISPEDEGGQFILKINGKKRKLFYNDYVIFYDDTEKGFYGITGTDCEHTDTYSSVYKLFKNEIIGLYNQDPLICPEYRKRNEKVLYITENAMAFANLIKLKFDEIIVIKMP